MERTCPRGFQPRQALHHKEKEIALEGRGAPRSQVTSPLQALCVSGRRVRGILRSGSTMSRHLGLTVLTAEGRGSGKRCHLSKLVLFELDQGCGCAFRTPVRGPGAVCTSFPSLPRPVRIGVESMAWTFARWWGGRGADVRRRAGPPLGTVPPPLISPIGHTGPSSWGDLGSRSNFP